MTGDDGRLEWHAQDQVLRRDPARSLWRWIQSGFFGWFNLDDQL